MVWNGLSFNSSDIHFVNNYNYWKIKTVRSWWYFEHLASTNVTCGALNIPAISAANVWRNRILSIFSPKFFCYENQGNLLNFLDFDHKKARFEYISFGFIHVDHPWILLCVISVISLCVHHFHCYFSFVVFLHFNALIAHRPYLNCVA